MISARILRFDHQNDFRKMILNPRPVGGGQDNNGNPPTLKILLIFEVLIRRDQNIEFLFPPRPASRHWRDSTSLFQMPLKRCDQPATLAEEPVCLDQRESSACRRNLERLDLGEAPSGIFKHRIHLLTPHTGKPLKKVIHPRTILEVFEKRPHRHTCATKKPLTAHLVRHPLHFGTLTPIEHARNIPKAHFKHKPAAHHHQRRPFSWCPSCLGG